MTKTPRRAVSRAKPAASVPDPIAPDPTAAGPAGGTLTWAVRLILGQAVVVALITLVSIWLALTTSSVGAGSAAATSGFFALYAAILAGLGISLGRKKALARGPSIVLQMLMIPLGYYMIVGGLAPLGVPVIAVGLLGSALLLAPSTRTALGLALPGSVRG